MGRLVTRLGWWALRAVILLPPLIVVPLLENPFRLPKLVLSAMLALLSALLLAAGAALSPAHSAARRSWISMVAGGSLLAVAVVSILASTHPEHGWRALGATTTAVVAVCAWVRYVSSDRLWKTLCLLVVPGVVLALLALLQFFGWFQPFRFDAAEGRLAVTSLAGNVGVLAAYLTLALLIVQAELSRSVASLGGGGKLQARGLALAAGAVLMLAALVVTQTLAAIAACGLGSVLFWWLAVPAPKRKWVALGTAVLAIVVGLLPPVAERLRSVWQGAQRGRIAASLSGRPDAWRAALHMAREHPITGVGLGGYRAEFGHTKLALRRQGVAFYSRADTVSFANAHNEPLEVVAELGILGALWLAALLAWVARCLWRLRRREAGLLETAGSSFAIAAAVALVVLGALSFPFRVALTAYPWPLVAAWLMRLDAEGGEPDTAGAPSVSSRRSEDVVWALALLVLLVWQGDSLWNRVWTSRALRLSELLTSSAGAEQPAARRQISAFRPVLEARLEHDPASVGVRFALGNHFLIMGRGARAESWYLRALELEPRANIHFNLAKALLQQEKVSAAWEQVDSALLLDESLREEALELGYPRSRLRILLRPGG